MKISFNEYNQDVPSRRHEIIRLAIDGARQLDKDLFVPRWDSFLNRRRNLRGILRYEFNLVGAGIISMTNDEDIETLDFASFNKKDQIVELTPLSVEDTFVDIVQPGYDQLMMLGDLQEGDLRQTYTHISKLSEPMIEYMSGYMDALDIDYRFNDWDQFDDFIGKMAALAEQFSHYGY